MTTVYTPSPTLLLALSGNELTDHFANLLRSAGYGIVPVTNPEDARRCLETGAVDLALLDVDWGAQAVALLAGYAHNGERRCPVALVVGWWDARAGEVAAQADAFIYKPPTQRQLLGSVRSLVEFPQPESLPA